VQGREGDREIAAPDRRGASSTGSAVDAIRRIVERHAGINHHTAAVAARAAVRTPRPARSRRNVTSAAMGTKDIAIPALSEVAGAGPRRAGSAETHARARQAVEKAEDLPGGFEGSCRKSRLPNKNDRRIGDPAMNAAGIVMIQATTMLFATSSATADTRRAAPTPERLQR